MSIAHKFEDRARTNDVLISETVDFPGLLLSKPVLKGLADGGFLKPSPIQLKAIPLGRCGLDLIVQAKSGTGKTCVFTVVALESVDITSPSLQVLVLAPTREIAQQIQGVIREIGSSMPGLKCHTFIGGLPILQDKILCKNCHIAVGTPGRVKQLLEIGALKANSIRLFVLDEADKLLENSFQESINWIYSSLPENKQILALSATYPEYLADHLTRYMRNPTFVRLNAADPALLGIKQYHAVVPHHTLPNFVFSAKTEMVVKIISSVSFQQCLIFSNMQTRAQDLQSELQARNWPTACIAGCLQQQERSFAMDQLKSYKCRILISTDLTSRGIDADKVNLVINLDVPPDHETYLHRIGRAGRFGSFGAAITIVSKGSQEKDLWRIEKLCKTYIHPLPDPLPNDLVARPVPVRLDDVVSTEQIITKPGSVTPEDFTEPRKTQPETEISDTSSEDTQASMLSEPPVADIKEDCLGSQDRIGDMLNSSVNTFQDSAETALHSGRSLLLLEKKYELQQNLSVTENGGKEDEILTPSEICDGGKQSFAQSDMTVNGQKVLALPGDSAGFSDQHLSLSETPKNYQLSTSVSTTCVNNQDSSSPDKTDTTQQLLLCGENSTALQQTGDSELEDTLLSGQGVNSRGDSSCLMSPVKIQQPLLLTEAEIHDPNTVFSSKCQGVAEEISVSQSATSGSVVNVSNNHLVSSTLSQDGDIDSQIDLDSVPSTACDDQETWTNDSLSETEKKEGDRNADNDEQETVNDIDQGETDETLSKSANSMNKDNYPCESANDQQVEAQSYNDVTETCSSMKADEIKNNNGAKTQSINETTQPCIPVKVDENEINNSAETSKDSASETCILTEPDESGTENGAKAQPTNDATDSDISTKAGQSKTINGAETQITDVTTEPCISLETDESESKNDDVADSCLSIEAGESNTVNGAKTQSNNEAMDLGTSTDADECKATYGANERSENGTKTQSNSDVTDSCILTKADECVTENSAEYGIENGIKTQSSKDNTEPCTSLETDESVWKDVVGTQSDDDDDDVTGVCFSIQADESVIENGAETEPNCDTTNPCTFIEANECGNKNVTTSDLCSSSINIIEGDLGGEKTSFKTDSPGCPLSEKSDRNEQDHDVSNGENPKGEPMYSQNFQLESERDQPVQSFIHALNPYVDNRNLSEVNPSDKTSIYLDFNNGNKKFVGCDGEMEQNVLFVDEQIALRDRNIWKDVEVNAEDSDNASDPELCVDSTQECKVNHGLHLSDFTATGKEAASADIESFNVQEDVMNAKDLTNNMSHKDEQIEATMGVAPLNSVQSTSTDQLAPLETDKTGTLYNEEYKTYLDKSGNINPDRPTQNLQGENLSLDVSKCKNIESLSKTSGSSSSSPGPAAKAKRKPPSRNFAVASFLEQLRSENENLSTLALAKSNILNTCKEDVTPSDTTSVDNIEESSPEAGLLDKNLSNLTEEEVQNIATPEVPSPEALSVRSRGKVTGENRSNSSTITKSKSYARYREDKRLSPASETNHSDESTKAISEHDVFDSDVIEVQKNGANVEIVDQDSESKVDIAAETDVDGSKKSSDSSSNSPSLIYSILAEERNSKNQPSLHDLENSLQMFKETYDDGAAKIPPKAISIFNGADNFSEDTPELQAYCKEETERLKSIKKLLIEKKQNVTKERQETSQATSHTSTPSKQSSESASEKKTPVRFKGPLPQEASSFEKALYEHVKARHRKDEGEVSSPDVLTQEESSESSVDVQQEKSPAKPVEDMQDKQVRHDVPSNEECKKLDDMHEEMLRKRKLRKANKKLETVAKEGQTGEGKLNQVMLSPNTSLQYVSNDSASADSSNQLQPFVEKQSMLHDEKDVTYNQTKIAVEERLDKNLTKRVDVRKGKQVLSQNSEVEEEDKNSEASPCMKSYIENVIYEQDNDTENECKNSPIRALRTSSKTAIHNQSNEAENKGRNSLSGSETKSNSVVHDENFKILLSNDTGTASEGTPSNSHNVRHPGIQTSAKKSLTPLFNAIHRKQLSSTKSKSQRIKQNPELKSLQICQRSPLKTLMVAQPDDGMLRYSSPEADNRSLKDNASKSIQNTPKKGKEVRAKIKQKNAREKVKEQGRGSQTRKETYVSPGEIKPIKPSKSAARLAGLEVSDGSTSSSETNSTSSRSLKKWDPKSKKKIYASACQAAAPGRDNYQDNESTSATSDNSDGDDFSYDMNKYFPYYPKYPSKVQSQHCPWYQPNPQRTAPPPWQQHWPSPGFNYTHSHTNSANRFHPHYLPSGMASMQPIHHPYYQYYHDYYSQYYPQYFHPVTHPPHPSLYSGYSVRDRQPQPYDSCYRAQSLPHSVEASMQWEYVCHMTQQSVRMGKKFRKSMKLRKS